MSEGHTYRCTWSLTTTGYRLWVVADPDLVREDAVFAEAAQELSYAILDKTGDGEAQLEFEPPPPGKELRPPALLRLWKLGLHDTVRYGNARESYEGGLCDNCLNPLGPRTRVPLEIVTPLPRSHLLDSQMADAGVGVGPSPRIFSPTIVAMLTDEERACFEWRPVRAEGRETRYLELIHRIPPTPQVAPRGAAAKHWRCETCGLTSLYVEQVGNEPFRFISTRDLPDPLPPALAMGRVSDSGLLISDARRREMLAQKGARSLTTEPVSVIPESLVDRSPTYLPWRRAHRNHVMRDASTLTNAHRVALLAAVPSFVPRWTAWQQEQLEYTSRFPEEKLSDEDEQHEFLREFAGHVAERLTAADAEEELAALFAALEEIYAEADAQLYSLLTLFLLEQLITDCEYKGQDAAQLQKYVHGPLTKRAWQAAWDWMHP